MIDAPHRASGLPLQLLQHALGEMLRVALHLSRKLRYIGLLGQLWGRHRLGQCLRLCWRLLRLLDPRLWLFLRLVLPLFLLLLLLLCVLLLLLLYLLLLQLYLQLLLLYLLLYLLLLCNMANLFLPLLMLLLLLCNAERLLLDLVDRGNVKIRERGCSAKSVLFRICRRWSFSGSFRGSFGL